MSEDHDVTALIMARAAIDDLRSENAEHEAVYRNVLRDLDVAQRELDIVREQLADATEAAVRSYDRGLAAAKTIREAEENNQLQSQPLMDHVRTAAMEGEQHADYLRGIEHGRVVAMEEAARLVSGVHSECQRDPCNDPEHSLARWLAGNIRALAPLPSTLVVLEKSVVEQVKAALWAYWNQPHVDSAAAHKAALAALEGR